MLKKIKKMVLNDYSTDTALRYFPVLDVIKKEKINIEKILEVGSGDLGITAYFKKNITGLDINFSNEKSEYLEKVKYDGEKFPFENDEFELTISVDSLEHILPEKRQFFMNEIFRVARKAIILVVPSGKFAAKQDEDLDIYFNKINNNQDIFLSEHIKNGLPGNEDILEYFKNANQNLNKKFKLVLSKKINNLKLRGIIMKCKISRNVFLGIIYYLFLILIPIRSFINFGNCYRNIYYLKAK